MSVFVTVGSTRFDELIDVVMGEECINSLAKLGLREIVVQRGSYERVFPVGVRHFGYVKQSEFQAIMRKARLVISHGGAGTIMEALLLGVPLVVVINEKLMDNHQSELAEALASRGLITACTVGNLVSVLGRLEVRGEKCTCCVDSFIAAVEELFE